MVGPSLEMLTILPPETVDAIINQLHDDKPSLSACGLACKQLLPRSRYHLFSEIHITADNVGVFQELLEETSSNIASLVQRLVIEGFRETFNEDDEMEDLQPLQRVSSHLPNVKYLHVIGFRNVIAFSKICDTISNLGSVKELVLEYLEFQSGDDVLAVVYAFPLLQRLSLIDMIWTYAQTTGWNYDGPLAQRSLSLGVIRLHDPEFKHITKWLLGMSPVPRVHSLSCSAFHEEASLVRAVGPSIHTLELTFGPSPINIDNIRLIDTSNCTNVRELSFRDIMIYTVTVLNNQPTFLTMLLSQFPSHNVEELALKFSTPDGISVFSDWSGLASILAGSRFPHLRSIFVQCVTQFEDTQVIHDWEQAKRSILQGPFLEFDRRGIVDFDLGHIVEADRDGGNGQYEG